MSYGTPGAIVDLPGYPGSIVQPFRKYPYGPALEPALTAPQNGSIKMPLEFYLAANPKI